MKYICLGYYDKAKFDGLPESERNAMFDACFEYDDHLRASGHSAGGEALQGPETALTLYWKNGKVATTDGPYAETKEQLGGIGVLEARDMNHAVQLMAQHPALKYGTLWEIRPAGDMSEIMKASEQRRRAEHCTLKIALLCHRRNRRIAGGAQRKPGQCAGVTPKYCTRINDLRFAPTAVSRLSGAGNGFTVWLLRHSQRKRGETARLDLRNTAPVLDPTGQRPANWCQLGMSTVENSPSHALTIQRNIREHPRPRISPIRRMP